MEKFDINRLSVLLFLFLLSVAAFLLERHPSETDGQVELRYQHQQEAGASAMGDAVSTSQVPPWCTNRTSQLFTSEGLARMYQTYEEHIDDWIVTVVDERYTETFDLWYRHYRRLQPQRRGLIVVAHGIASFNKLKESCLCGPDSSNVIVTLLFRKMKTISKEGKLALWQQRIQLLDQFVHKLPMFNYIFTDADAYWLKEPNDMLTASPALQNADVIASRGRFPKRCHVTDAFTICMGFIWFRSSQATRDYVSRLKKYNDKVKDDQIAANCLLTNTSYVRVGEEIPLESSIETDNSTAMLTFRHEEGTPELKIALLAYNLVVRLCESGQFPEEVFVAHCRAFQTPESKAKTAESFNLALGENEFPSCFGG